MKILEFNKKFWFIVSLVFIALACLLMLLNKLSYNQYIEMKQEYVEVDCTVIAVDDIKRTIRVAYAYKNVEYYAVFETTQYKLLDNFTGVIRPDDPTKLRFDNGYSFWNSYTVFAILLTSIAILLDIIIIKRTLVRYICMKKEKVTLSILEIKSWHGFHYLVVEHNDKQYKSEIFKTFEDINFLEKNVVINLYISKKLHYIDLSSYTRVR